MKNKILSYGLILIGGLITVPVSYASPITEKGDLMVNDLFSKTKPQCIGIYQIEVPESFENDAHTATYDDFKIESKTLYPPAFKQQIMLREQELNDAINKPGNDKEKNSPFIKEIIRLPNDSGVIFDRNKTGSEDAYRTLEAHIYTGGTAFVITANFVDLSQDKYAEKRKLYSRLGFTPSKMNEKPTKLAALRSLILQLSGRLDYEIPSGKGICIPNGFITDDGREHEATIGYSYKNNDFLLGINTNSKIAANGDTLFKRSDSINDALSKTKMKTLKKYAATPNGIPVEAWLFHGRWDSDTSSSPVYDFLLYANEAVASPSRPLIKMEIDNSGDATRYNAVQMVDIWDRIVGSLRYR